MYSTISLPGFKDAIITQTETRDHQYIIHFEMPVKPHICPACGKETQKVHDYRVIKIKHLKMMERMTLLFYRKRRYVCACGKRFAEENPIVSRYQRYTKEWNQMAQIRAVKGKTFKETAVQYGTSVSTIIRRFDQIVPASASEKQSLPKVIAIDEFKGNAGREKFQLIIADPVTREPIDVLPNRKKATIKAYLSKYGANVETVIMDMSYSFRAAVEEALDKPVIIADRFHFVRCVNKSMEKVRIRVQEEWNDYDRKKVKKKRFVFLKGSKKMTDKDRWYLQRYFTFSQELEKAYELKEHYFQWFKQAKENGENAIGKTKETLETIYKKVEEANIPEFLSIVKTYRNWQTEILNSFVFGYSNGFVEGLNNLIKVIKRNAFGFRNFKRLRAKILLYHQYKKIGNEIG